MQGANTTETKLTPEQQLLLKGLEDLHCYADKVDITNTSAALEMNDGTVRRYLRGIVHDWDTAKRIHDHLRKLTIARGHKMMAALNAA